MKKLIKKAKKIGIALVGFPLLIVGIILIPLPGPGLLVCLLAFLILSAEFDWASRYLREARSKLNDIYIASKARADKIEHWADKKNQQ